MQQDYYSILADVVMASARDDAQRREMIYELARSTLRQQLNLDARRMGASQKVEQLLALETAIGKVEADLAQNFPRHQRVLPIPGRRSIELIPPIRPQDLLSGSPYEFPEEVAKPPVPTKTRWPLGFIIVAILVLMGYVMVDGRFRQELELNGATAQNGQASISRLPNRPSVQPIPTPTAYGVYALADKHLMELEPLPIQAPDQRVAISATISSPSSTKLPDGRAQFIVFKRDLANNAPEKVLVRVVAQVASPPGDGTAPTKNADPAWVIRNISYEMKVAPVDGNPAMILIRPADDNFSFPAGRYALVLKSIAYDFSVAGAVEDLAQCIERTDDPNGAPVIRPCRKR